MGPGFQNTESDLDQNHFPERELKSKHSTILNKDIRVAPERIQAMFEGIALGDALGLPVETWSRQRIASEVGPIRSFLSNEHNPFLEGKDVPPGTISDDTQLSLAVLSAVRKALTEEGEILDLVADEHVRAYQETTLGWGGSTRDSARRLSEGVHWSESGRSDNPERGYGNGIPMKIAPLALYILEKELDESQIVELVAAFAGMTHPTEMSVSAGLAHVAAVTYCLGTAPEDFSSETFVSLVSEWASKASENTSFKQNDDDIVGRLRDLKPLLEADVEEVIDLFGAGGCYVFDSLPFTYRYFLENPTSIDSLYKVIEAGGDTDSNGAMVGALIGALCGAQAGYGELGLEVSAHSRIDDEVQSFIRTCL